MLIPPFIYRYIHRHIYTGSTASCPVSGITMSNWSVKVEKQEDTKVLYVFMRETA